MAWIEQEIPGGGGGSAPISEPPPCISHTQPLQHRRQRGICNWIWGPTDLACLPILQPCHTEQQPDAVAGGGRLDKRRCVPRPDVRNVVQVPPPQPQPLHVVADGLLLRLAAHAWPPLGLHRPRRLPADHFHGWWSIRGRGGRGAGLGVQRARLGGGLREHAARGLWARDRVHCRAGNCLLLRRKSWARGMGGMAKRSLPHTNCQRFFWRLYKSPISVGVPAMSILPLGRFVGHYACLGSPWRSAFKPAFFGLALLPDVLLASCFTSVLTAISLSHCAPQRIAWIFCTSDCGWLYTEKRNKNRQSTRNAIHQFTVTLLLETHLQASSGKVG